MKNCNFKSVFSIDVEDWFNISNVDSEPKITEWDNLPSRVERNFNKLLDIMLESKVKSTCFFLGYFAKRFPELVIRAFNEGHEIASHGFYHQLAFKQTPSEFYEDISGSKKLLEDIISDKVYGYRAPSFSVTNENKWFFEKIIDAGYMYDASVFPAKRDNGGMNISTLKPHILKDYDNKLIEFPMSTISYFNKRFCFSGGGYLRLFPYKFIKYCGKVVNKNNILIFYIHPREIDVNHPKLKMNIVRKFKTYINIAGTEKKLKTILKDFDFYTFKDIIT